MADFQESKYTHEIEDYCDNVVYKGENEYLKGMCDKKSPDELVKKYKVIEDELGQKLNHQYCKISEGFANNQRANFVVVCPKVG